MPVAYTMATAIPLRTRSPRITHPMKRLMRKRLPNTPANTIGLASPPIWQPEPKAIREDYDLKK
jgi:hypothetical protein